MTTKDDEYALLRSAAQQNAASIRIARERAEQRQEAYWAEAQRLSHTGSFGWKVSTGEIVWSEETFRIFQYDRATQPTVERVLQRAHPEDAAFVKQTIERASQDGKDFEHEYRLVMPDGLVKHVHVVARASSDASGELEFVGAVMDVTEQHRAEEVLREQASLLDLTHDTVFVRDMNDTITYWNRGAEELYGWNREQAVGKTTRQLLQTSFPEPLAEINAALLRTGRWEGELTHTKRDGAQVVVATRWALQRDARGNAVAVLETNNDITERRRSEAELLRQTALLDELFVGGPDAVALSSLEKRVVRVNREFDALFGYAAEEVVGVSLADLIVPEDELERSRAARARAQSTVGRVAFEGMRRRKDGTLIQVSIKGGPIVLRGQPIGYYAMYRDITERKRAEEALRLSEERYALAMLAAEDAHWDWVVGTDQYYLSPRTLDLFGLPPDTVFTSREDYLARTPLVREDLEKWQRAMAELFAGTGSRLSMELRAVVRGEIRWLQHIGVCVRDASGRPVRWSGTARDITERKRKEAEVLHKTALLDELFEGSPDAVVLMDLEARVLRISREFAALFGYAAEEAAGRPVVDLIVPEDELENSRAGLARARSGERFVVERERRRKDGTRIHVSIKRAPIVLGGKLIGYYGIYRDITQRKRAEEAQRAREREREEMQRQLQQAAKMEAIGRLAGGIAHDFNNILGAILGYGELAQKNLEGRAVRRHVDQVMQAGARGKGLVERILAFSRSGLGERVPVHVQSVVEETLEILAASLLPQVRLEKRLDAGDTAVVGDATQLHQVAMNLCTNALQAMEHGGVLTVVLDRESVPERRLLSHGTLLPGPYVRLSVSDTGSGIAPAVLERMFDPFFTTKGVGDGTGLGLSLVHGIVADFGGAIDVTTQAGAGTTFTVWLPASGETPRLLAEPVGELPQGNGETVMIVDDQRSLVALAEETLAELGYEPAGFDSSVAALQAFRAEPQRFDLVLTDETMPDMSGVELVREIRRVRPELPIVLMSGYSGAQLTERARAAGAGEVLRKPLVRRDIAEALARALRTNIAAATK
jgi:PAS domain S-box-containing protein